mgnify:CR=1 FL=1
MKKTLYLLFFLILVILVTNIFVTNKVINHGIIVGISLLYILFFYKTDYTELKIFGVIACFLITLKNINNATDSSKYIFLPLSIDTMLKYEIRKKKISEPK